MNRVFTAIVALLVVLTGLTFAQDSPMIVADEVLTKAPTFYSNSPNIARSSNDLLMAAWFDGSQVVYSTWDSGFLQWSIAVAISNAGDLAAKVGLAVDNSGNIYAAWQQRETSGEDYAVYFAKFDGATWTTPVNLSGNDAENEESSITVNDQGKIFVCWNTDSEADGAEFIFCVNSTDGVTWSDRDTLSSVDGIIGGGSVESARVGFTSGKDGKVVAVWQEMADDGASEDIFVAQYDGAEWADEMRATFTSDGNRYGATVLDDDDNIYIAWRGHVPDDFIAFKKKVWDAAWPADADTAVAIGSDARMPNIVIDENGYLYIAFRNDMEGDLSYYQEISYTTSIDKGANWSAPVRLSRENYDAGYVTMAPVLNGSAIDVLWRECSDTLVSEQDTTSVMYGKIELIPVSIEDNDGHLAGSYKLQQNYPNPFNPETVIRYELATAGQIKLAVYNLLGQKIHTLVDAQQKAGAYEVNFRGTGLSSGIYFYKLSGQNFSLTEKMILMQ